MAAAIAASIAINLFCKSVFAVNVDPGPLKTIISWINIRALDPMQYARYLSAIFNAFGGFLVIFIVLIIEHVRNKESDRNYLPELMAGAGYLSICFFAGSDLTKFAFMAFPLMLPIVLDLTNQYIDRIKFWWAWLIVILGFPVAHIIEPILSPFRGREMPNLDVNGPYSWVMEYAHPFLVIIWLIGLCIMFIVAKIMYRNVKCVNDAK